MTLLNLSGEAPVCDYSVPGQFLMGFFAIFGSAVSCWLLVVGCCLSLLLVACLLVITAVVSGRVTGQIAAHCTHGAVAQ